MLLVPMALPNRSLQQRAGLGIGECHLGGGIQEEDVVRRQDDPHVPPLRRRIERTTSGLLSRLVVRTTVPEPPHDSKF